MNRASDFKQAVQMRNIEAHLPVLRDNLASITQELGEKEGQRIGLLRDIQNLSLELSTVQQEVNTLREEKADLVTRVDELITLLDIGDKRLKEILELTQFVVSSIDSAEASYQAQKLKYNADLQEAQKRVTIEQEKIKLPEENMIKREAQLMQYEADIRIMDARIRAEWRKLHDDKHIPLKEIV